MSKNPRIVRFDIEWEKKEGKKEENNNMEG